MIDPPEELRIRIQVRKMGEAKGVPFVDVHVWGQGLVALRDEDISGIVIRHVRRRLKRAA